MKITSFIRYKLRKKKKIEFINSDSDLIFLDERLCKYKVLGIDTEFDWRSTYFPKLSLIQISTKDTIFLIDCINLYTKDILEKYLQNKNYLKIFHSVRSDTTVLSKNLNLLTMNVFDIQIAEKFISSNEIKSYGKIVKTYIGLNLKKNETNSNWLKRPLSKDQIIYAAEDVDFLIDIYDSQKKILLKKGYLDEAIEQSENEANLGNKSLKELRLKKLKDKLSKRNRDIFIWREDLAEEKNVPPAYIFKNKHLKKLSNIEPTDHLAKKKVMKILGDSKVSEDFIAEFL
tara:strand:- start:987 stop:1847 length:861 start_codon:yes stop_codon:yes gene_type:complete